MSALRKLTITLPARLVEDTIRNEGKGVTESIREALEARRRERAWERLKSMRGKSRITETWQELRGKDDPEKDWR